MAVLTKFKCEKCGYELYADKHGHYALMMGECYLFRCTTCKEIVGIVSEQVGDKLHAPICPNCGIDTEDEMYSWNPIEGHCPKCDGKMVEDLEAPIMMAD